MIDIDKLARESGGSFEEGPDRNQHSSLAWWTFSPDELQLYTEKVMLAAQKAERERSKILKHALNELFSAKLDSEKGAGWDISRAQRVWREAGEAVSKYEVSDTQSSHNCTVLVEALLIIAGKKQCIDNLMSDQDIALDALTKYEREK
jgi:hypothetical protein